MNNFKGGFCYIIAILSLSYFLGMMVMTPAFGFNFIFFGIGIFFFIYGAALSRLSDNNLFKKVNMIIKTFIILGMILFTGMQVAIGYFAFKKDAKPADYLVVLGAGLLDGDRISQSLKTRLDESIKYLNENDNGEKVLVTGGQGIDETVSEAFAMKNYLVDKGIDESRILMEDKSTSTFENFKFTKEVIEKDSSKPANAVNIKIFTNGFHMFRSNFLAKRVGFDNVSNYSSDTPWYLVPSYYTREIFAIGKSFVVDK